MRAGGLDGLLESAAGFGNAALIYQDEHEVAPGSDERRVELNGAADERLGFSRADLGRERSAVVAELPGNRTSISTQFHGAFELDQSTGIVLPAQHAVVSSPVECIRGTFRRTPPLARLREVPRREERAWISRTPAIPRHWGF